jgi:Fe-S-cluster containining protein
MQLDCLACGACCFGPDDYVAVTEPDLDRMSKEARGRFVHRGKAARQSDRRGRRFLRMVNGHCAALHARQGHFSCRIYKERPTPCRVVEAGSRECLDARRRRGLD